MTISDKEDLALKVLEPSVLQEPQNDFFIMLLGYGDESKNETIVGKKLVKKEFQKFVLEYDPSYNKKKAQLNKIADDIIKKLRSIMWIDIDDESIEIKWDDLKKFYKLLKFIKKSDERIVLWGIYHLFYSNNTQIELSKLKKILEPLKISNIDRYVQKIIKDSKNDGLDIDFDGNVIKINHDKKKDAKIIRHNLADQLEFLSRRSRQGLEQEILDMLDEGSYSNSEISEILDVDKSHVSKVLTKLEKNGDLIHSSFGSRGRHFYTTNCNNCPFATNYDACRKESTSFIKNTLKNDFQLDVNNDFFEDIEYNQSLLYIKRILTEGKKDKSSKMEDTTTRSLFNLYSMILEKIKADTLKKSKSSYYNIYPLIEKMPIPVAVGNALGSMIGISLISTLLEKSISEYIPKSKQNEVKAKIMEEYKKISKIKRGLDEFHAR